MPSPKLLLPAHEGHRACVAILADIGCSRPCVTCHGLHATQFMGVVEEVGADVKKVKKGERYVCCFDIGCGECFYCQRQLFSCCMRSNPSNMTCGLYGHKLGGFYGAATKLPIPSTCTHPCQCSGSCNPLWETCRLSGSCMGDYCALAGQSMT